MMFLLARRRLNATRAGSAASVVLCLRKGLLGDIYGGAQSRFNNPVNLKRLITLINEIEWTSLQTDVKAEAYESLLEKAASEGKKGAGQYFTPRVLIQSIVRCLKPDPRAHKDFTIYDPACGTGGFLVAAYEWLVEQTKGGALDRETAKRVRKGTYFGAELVARPRRLALMNLYLHGLEPEITLADTIYETPTTRRFDVVLANPPFGTKGAKQAPDREDFTIETSNKQLNFLQHILTVMKPGVRAGVVLPETACLKARRAEVFEILMQDCNVHTVLRLPRGTFTPYSQGVKANVIFFQKGYPTEAVWIFDARSNVPGITKKDRPLTPAHFAEFKAAYGSDPAGRSELPEGWTWTTLEDVCSKVQDGTHFSPKQQSSSEVYKYITAKNIKTWGIDLTEVTYLNEEVHREIYNRCNPEKGDVLYIKDGATTGIATVNTLDEEFSLLSSVALLKPLNNCLNSHFLKWYWNSPNGYKAMTDQMTGSAITRIILRNIRASAIPLAPLNEQQRIVAKLEKLLSRVDAAQARLATIPRILKRFRQFVLAAACSGRLTVNWREQNQVAEEHESATIEDVADYVGGFAYKSPTFMETGVNQVIRIGNVRPFILKLDTSPVFIPDEIAKTTERFQLAPNDIVISMTGTKYKKDYGYAAIITGNEPKLFLNQG